MMIKSAEWQKMLAGHPYNAADPALVAARRAAVARERERLRRLDRQLAALEAELRSCDVANAPRLVLDCPAAGLGAA